jgi:hypothetical protein
LEFKGYGGDFEKQKIEINREKIPHDFNVRRELARAERNLNKEEKRNFMFIDSVPYFHLESDNASLNQELNLGTISKTKALLNECRKWFNDKFENEINETILVKRKANQKETYKKKTEQERLERLANRSEQQKRIMKLLSDGVPKRKIPELTGISYGTINRILSEILTLVENQ